MEKNVEYLKLKEVIAMTKISKATIYRRLNAGEFPQPKRLSPRTIRWLKQDVEQWMVR